MSSEIEYRHLVLSFSRHGVEEFMRVATGNDKLYVADYQSTFLVFVESGANNCSDFEGKPSKSWKVQAGGDHSHVIKQTCEWSYYAEGGMTHLRRYRGNVTAEGYIRHYKKLITDAVDSDRSRDLIEGCSVKFRTSAVEIEKSAVLSLARRQRRLIGLPGDDGSMEGTIDWMLTFSEGDYSAINADAYALGQIINTNGHTWVYPGVQLYRRIEHELQRREMEAFRKKHAA